MEERIRILERDDHRLRVWDFHGGDAFAELSGADVLGVRTTGKVDRELHVVGGGFVAVVIFAAGLFHDASGKNGQQ